MSEQRIEDKKDRPVPKPEALDQRYIAQKRHDESSTWVKNNQNSFYQALMKSRSFWQQLVDWAHQHPVLYGAIVVPASLLITGGILAAFFFAGAPLLGVMIGAGIAILSVGLISVGVYLDKTTIQPIEDFFDELCDQYSPTISNQQKQNQLNNAINAMKPSMRATANVIVAAQKSEFDNKKYEVPLGIQAKEKLRQLFQKDVPADFPLSVNDFIDSQDACCKTSGKEESELYFKSTYFIHFKSQATIRVEENNSEKK